MASSFFQDMLGRLNPKAVLDISSNPKARVLIISDLHMGDGGRGDDLSRNRGLLLDLLEKYYLERDYCLVLNGDIEELQRFSLGAVRAAWGDLYAIFDRFAAKGRLFKTFGNHDEGLIFEKDYPYSIYNAIKIETGVVPVYVYHGHQSSTVYTSFNGFIRVGLRYFLKPLGIRNISSGRNPYKRYSVERNAYMFSLENRCVSVIGHTHRPLFESLGRFDFIKFEIERLCRLYPYSRGKEKEYIAREVKMLQFEMGKLKRSEKRDVLRHSLYGDDVPVPCLFNSGCAIGKKGINVIEMDQGKISLVYWFTEGQGKKFVGRGGYKIRKVSQTGRCRVVLNRDTFDFIKAKIQLLGDVKHAKSNSDN